MPKKNKDRRPRKDKGKKRKCMASVLSGVPLHVREHLAIIKNSNFACNGNEKLPNEISKRTDEKELPVVNDKEIMPPTSNIVDKGTEKEPNNPLNITEQIHNKDLKQKFVRIWQNTTNLGEILILEDTRHYL